MLDKRIANMRTVLIYLFMLYVNDICSNVLNTVEEICTKQRYSRKVERPGCSKTQSFVVDACIGNCISYDEPLADVPYFQSKCQVCKAVRTEFKEFYLAHCENEDDRKVEIESALECSCVFIDDC